MSTDSVMMHVRLNKKLKENAENVADSFGLSLSGLVKVLLTGVVNNQGIPNELLKRRSYEQYLDEKVEEALSGKKSHQKKQMLFWDLMSKNFGKNLKW